jgi:uncharacterized protein YdhG (YjbR/CyaY superfamily)
MRRRTAVRLAESSRRAAKLLDSTNVGWSAHKAKSVGTKAMFCRKIQSVKQPPTLPGTVDEYILSFPPAVQSILKKVRATVLKAAPQAEETMKYRLPTLVLNGNLVHFGAFKNHIGFYATPTGNEQFRRELSVYKGAKGSVQFPLSEPIPFNLISKIVRFRVRENMERAAVKKTRAKQTNRARGSSPRTRT